MFGNRVLRLCLRVTVKLNFRTYIRRYTSPNENIEYSYPLDVSYWDQSISAFIYHQHFVLNDNSFYTTGLILTKVGGGKKAKTTLIWPKTKATKGRGLLRLRKV